MMILALVVSLALQVGVNYANDYSDGVRGTDLERVGPRRLVASGDAPASAVRTAAVTAFIVAAFAGLVVALTTSLWLLAVGAAAIAAAWFYTGGPRPYGYAGLGEPFVFVFFGLVATIGTTFAVARAIDPWSWATASALGALACALLVVNNLRDIPGDERVGKNTLAVRLGDARTRVLYVALLAACGTAVGLTAIAIPFALIAFAAAPLALSPIRAIRSGARGGELVGVLAATGRLQLAVGILLAIGVAI